MDHAPHGQHGSHQGISHHAPQGVSQQGYQHIAPQGVSQQGYQQHAPQGVSQQGYQQHHAPQGTSQHGSHQGISHHAPQGVANHGYQQNHAPQGISQQKFEVFVRYFADSKMYKFEVTNNTTVNELKIMIKNKISVNLPEELQRLTCGGTNLDEGTMQENGIRPNHTILLIARVLGG